MPSMIQQIVRICEIVDQYLKKTILIFLKNFLDFKSHIVEKQSIIKISN